MYSGVWSACGKSDAHMNRSAPNRSASAGMVRSSGSHEIQHPLAEVVARLVLERHARADERVAVDGVDAVEPVADPAAARLEHEHLEPRELVEHAVVEQRRELVAHAVGGRHRREQPQLLDVLPRAHARALRPLRLERRVDRERHVEVLGGGEHRVVVGVAERPAVVGERRDVARRGRPRRRPARAPWPPPPGSLERQVRGRHERGRRRRRTRRSSGCTRGCRPGDSSGSSSSASHSSPTSCTGRRRRCPRRRAPRAARRGPCCRTAPRAR